MGFSKKKKSAQSTVKKPVTSKKFSLSTLFFGLVLSWACYFIITWYMFEPSSGTFAPSTEFLRATSQNVTCSEDYKSYPVFYGCTPRSICGRGVEDGIVSEDEIASLIRLVTNGLAYGGSNGGASILDLHSGAMSMGDKFVNIYKYLEKPKLAEAFAQNDLEAYQRVKNKIHGTIAEHFGIDSSKLHLTNPTFFSRLTAAPAQTKHDEYWHSHIDKIQYGSFDYTSLVYLTTYGQDFTGGQFVFDGSANATIEPRKGRVSFFTSGSENPHHVEKVMSGTRYAVTISFTCDPAKAINEPNLNDHT